MMTIEEKGMGHIIGIDHCDALQVLNLFPLHPCIHQWDHQRQRMLGVPIHFTHFPGTSNILPNQICLIVRIRGGQEDWKMSLSQCIDCFLVCLNRMHNFALAQQISMSSPPPHDYLLPMTTIVPKVASTVEWKIFVTPALLLPAPCPRVGLWNLSKNLRTTDKNIR